MRPFLMRFWMEKKGREQKKRPSDDDLFVEVPPRIELGIKELQSTALPLGYGTVWSG